MDNGSRMVRVLKRDGSVEDLSPRRLAACLWRGMRGEGGRFEDALDLSSAIEAYLTRKGHQCISSAAVFEMAVKVLHRVRIEAAAQKLELFSHWRTIHRARLMIVHDGGQVSQWSKSWLAQLACRSWDLTPRTGRIVAGAVEMELLRGTKNRLSRLDVLDRMNAHVAAMGLADAVPVRH